MDTLLTIDLPRSARPLWSAFENRYKEYEAMTQTGEIKHFKRVQAKDLWRKMLDVIRDRSSLDYI